MHAKDVVVDNRSEGHSVKHRVASLPDFLAQRFPETVLRTVRGTVGVSVRYTPPCENCNSISNLFDGLAIS